MRSTFWLAMLPAQFLITSGANIPLILALKNFDKIRAKYQKKYKKHIWQHFLLRHSFTSPLGAAALYLPLLLINYDFIPSFARLESHFLTNSLIPFYMSIPLGIIVIIFALSLVKLSGEHDRDMDLYMYMIDPYKNRIIKEGIYRYIRHPRILIRFTLSFGFALIANNLLALSISFVHFMPYTVYFLISDNELGRRFGDEFKSYRRNVPALFPKYGKWRKFIRLIIFRKEE
jgi:protein-S-isoprenylcysteine O-methyltransferase Ste14